MKAHRKQMLFDRAVLDLFRKKFARVTAYYLHGELQDSGLKCDLVEVEAALDRLREQGHIDSCRVGFNNSTCVWKLAA